MALDNLPVEGANTACAVPGRGKKDGPDPEKMLMRKHQWEERKWGTEKLEKEKTKVSVSYRSEGKGKSEEENEQEEEQTFLCVWGWSTWDLLSHPHL